MGTLPALCWNKKDILPPHMPDHRIMPPGPVLYGCHHKSCSRKFAQICQMCRLVNAQPCTATDPDNTGIIVCRIFRINQIHTKILRGVSEPCICLCKCDVCNHGLLRCSRFHMNCSFHTNSPLQCCFLSLL